MLHIFFELLFLVAYHYVIITLAFLRVCNAGTELFYYRNEFYSLHMYPV